MKIYANKKGFGKKGIAPVLVGEFDLCYETEWAKRCGREWERTGELLLQCKYNQIISRPAKKVAKQLFALIDRDDLFDYIAHKFPALLIELCRRGDFADSTDLLIAAEKAQFQCTSLNLLMCLDFEEAEMTLEFDNGTSFTGELEWIRTCYGIGSIELILKRAHD